MKPIVCQHKETGRMLVLAHGSPIPDGYFKGLRFCLDYTNGENGIELVHLLRRALAYVPADGDAERDLRDAAEDALRPPAVKHGPL